MSPSPRNGKPPGERLLRFLASDYVLLFTTALIIAGVYLLDTVTPLGQPVWLLYFIPLIISFWSARYNAIPAVFTATLVLLIAGFYLSPQGIPVNLAILNRFTFFLLFFVLALLLWWVRRRQIREENL